MYKKCQIQGEIVLLLTAQILFLRSSIFSFWVGPHAAPRAGSPALASACCTEVTEINAVIFMGVFIYLFIFTVWDHSSY